MDPDTQYAIERSQLDVLTALAKRLYTQDRMSADDMRDMAHRLMLVVKRAEDVPIPEEYTR